MPPSGSPPGGSHPGKNTGSDTYTLSGAYTIDGTTAEETGKTYTSDKTDVSAIYVTNGGSLTLNSPVISTSGDTTSNDASSFYGLNGAVLANNGSTVVIDVGSITTIGSGANGAIPTGEGTSLTLRNTTISASGDGGHGVMATLGASLILENVDIVTTGPHGAPIATDRGSGTVTVTGGTFTSSGSGSPGIYSTGVITVDGGVFTCTGTEAAVIEGSNTITLKNTSLTGGDEDTPGVMIYQSFSGDAEVGEGTFTMEGGLLENNDGPVFFITNTAAVITLDSVELTSTGDVLVNASGTSRWGKDGENGGTVFLTITNTDLSGSLLTDEISSISATLRDHSTLTGTINTAALSLDATSTWEVTGDSVLTGLNDPDGISGNSIMNIIGNGYTVTYDPDDEVSSILGGKTYFLANGGTLVPE